MQSWETLSSGGVLSLSLPVSDNQFTSYEFLMRVLLEYRTFPFVLDKL